MRRNAAALFSLLVPISVSKTLSSTNFDPGEGSREGNKLIESVSALRQSRGGGGGGVLYFTTLPSLHQVEGNQTLDQRCRAALEI